MQANNKQTNNKSVGVKRAQLLSSLQKRQVRQILESRLELKSYTASTGTVTVATTGTVYDMTNMSQGVTGNQRVGDEVTIKRFSFRYSIQVGAPGLIAAADEFNSVRVIIFKWREDAAAIVPVTASILNTTSATNPVLRQYNKDQPELYHVLYDKTITVFNTPIWNGAAVTWQHGVEANFASDNIVLSGPKLGKIMFNAASTLGEGQIHVLLLSDSAFAPNPTCEVATLVEYTDA